MVFVLVAQSRPTLCDPMDCSLPSSSVHGIFQAEELYKKGLNDLNNYDGVITQLEPDILECPVKRALGSITMNKTCGDDGISAELFKILKDDAVKVLHSVCQQIWKIQ